MDWQGRQLRGDQANKRKQKKTRHHNTTDLGKLPVGGGNLCAVQQGVDVLLFVPLHVGRASGLEGHALL